MGVRPAKDGAGRRIRRMGGYSECWVSWKGGKEWTGVGQGRTVCVLPGAGGSRL